MGELRWKPEQPAGLVLLGSAGADVSHDVRILDLSGRRMRISSKFCPNAGAAVRLMWDGQLVLGEVLSAEPNGFRMEIHHMLLDNAGTSWQKNGWQHS